MLSGADHTALDAVEVEVRRILDDDVGGVRQAGHTVPAAVQFAVQPASAYPAGTATPRVGFDRQSEPARDSSNRRNEASRPGLE